MRLNGTVLKFGYLGYVFSANGKFHKEFEHNGNKVIVQVRSPVPNMPELINERMLRINLSILRPISLSNLMHEVTRS